MERKNHYEGFPVRKPDVDFRVTQYSMVMEDWVLERELWPWTWPPWFAP